MKNLITVRQKIVTGLKNLFSPFFALIALKFKMKFWKKIDFLFVLTIGLYLLKKTDAEQRGDSFLAKLFDRVPEKYVEDIFGKENYNPEIECLKKFRSLSQQLIDSKEFFNSDSLQLRDLKSKMFSAVTNVNK